MKKKKISKILITVGLVAVLAVAGMLAANYFINDREEYSIALETFTLSEYAQETDKVMKQNFKTGEDLECTGISIMLVAEDGALKIGDMFNVEFLDRKSKRSFTSTSGSVWAYEEASVSDEFSYPLVSVVFDALGNIDFISLVKENNENADCSDVSIDYHGETKSYSYDENGLRTFNDNKDEELNFPSYVYEKGKIERIHFLDEVDGSFICLNVHAGDTYIAVYVPKTYEK
ncbi:MAG: hypothetical protein IJO03_05700 [Clostridia bacterium]|nr:hypothetical protein [Clostridia bacterium]